MSNTVSVSRETTLFIRDTCLCLHAQRAARALGRRFDLAFRRFGLTNGQFSLMMSLNRPDPPTISAVATFLAMDRTTLTAALKPLQRRGLIEVRPGTEDRRSRLLVLTDEGRALLARAAPVWRSEHESLEAEMVHDPQILRDALMSLAGPRSES